MPNVMDRQVEKGNEQNGGATFVFVHLVKWRLQAHYLISHQLSTLRGADHDELMFTFLNKI